MSKDILIFAGTTEGRELSEKLSAYKLNHIVCVATEYGEIVLKKNDYARVHQGRMDEQAMVSFMRSHELSFVVDATHPFAKEVTKNIETAANMAGIRYLRLSRDTSLDVIYDGIRRFVAYEECAKALAGINGNILLTTGSKNIEAFGSVKERCYVRVLPSLESLGKCYDAGFEADHVIAMQGPFSAAMNAMLIKEYSIGVLVTKESGRAGGINEKIQAAKEAGIPVYMISDSSNQGMSFDSVLDAIRKEYGIGNTMNITLAGIGPGGESARTREVCEAIKAADYVLGAKRMLDGITGKQTAAIYSAAEIVSFLKGISNKCANVVILFSGDTGFYSGAAGVNRALKKAVESGELACNVCILPGISSVSYFSSKIGVPYEDGHIMSVHGKDEAFGELIWNCRTNRKTICIMSGREQVNSFIDELRSMGLSDMYIHVGYNLSYPDERIVSGKILDINVFTLEGLYICMLINETSQKKAEVLSPGLDDGEFIRDKVPMTKEEIRMVSICKLKLNRGAVVWDIGCGTGSVSCEIARLDSSIMVYGIDKNEEAVKLSAKNRDKFELSNFKMINGNAPLDLKRFPKATHAFIGGSSGNMAGILDYLYEVNDHMRVVINGITVETINEIYKAVNERKVTDVSIVQLNVSRSKRLGGYHMMEAENPVWVCAFNFDGQVV